jgi:hypothetical protein
MAKMGAYQPPEKFKNYLLPTSKPFRSHAFYEEKIWTLQERIYKKLKKIAEFLESLYPKLTDDFSKNIKVVIEKNLETLIKDLDHMQSCLHQTPYSFNTNKLKTNQRSITEMKKVCDTLQTVRSYEHESKKLGKIKHELNELEHLIQPSSFQKSLEKSQAKNKPKTVPAKKEQILVEAKKKLKEKPKVNLKKQKVISKKAKTSTKLVKPIKIDSKKQQKSKAPVHKLNQSEKKVTKPKPKLPAKHKKVLTAKPKSKPKSSAQHKKKLSH